MCENQGLKVEIRRIDSPQGRESRRGLASAHFERSETAHPDGQPPVIEEFSLRLPEAPGLILTLQFPKGMSFADLMLEGVKVR